MHFMFAGVIYLCSVVALSSPQYKVGDTITMKLMVREKVSYKLVHIICTNSSTILLPLALYSARASG